MLGPLICGAQDVILGSDLDCETVLIAHVGKERAISVPFSPLLSPFQPFREWPQHTTMPCMMNSWRGAIMVVSLAPARCPELKKAAPTLFSSWLLTQTESWMNLCASPSLKSNLLEESPSLAQLIFNGNFLSTCGRSGSA
jgi:hypothetical protein